ncbi:hypothetical protein PLESTF_000459000 [Pleodorina starrii]|nr:hypothetical protein PLESTF_000459000 [Pleodorina starrii]
MDCLCTVDCAFPCPKSTRTPKLPENCDGRTPVAYNLSKQAASRSPLVTCSYRCNLNIFRYLHFVTPYSSFEMAETNAATTYLAKAKAVTMKNTVVPLINKKPKEKKQASLARFVKAPLPASYTARSPRSGSAKVSDEVISLVSSPDSVRTMPKAAERFGDIRPIIVDAATPSLSKPPPAAPSPSPSVQKPSASNKAAPPPVAPSPSPSAQKPSSSNKAAPPPAAPSPSPVMGVAQPEEAAPTVKAGAKARGTGQKEWSNIDYRREIDAQNCKSGMLQRYPWVVRLDATCTYRCSICFEQKKNNVFTKPDGAHVLLNSELQRHQASEKHKTAELEQEAATKSVIQQSLAAMSAKAQAEAGPLEAKLMRCAFTTFKNNQSVSTYVDNAVLMAACDGASVKVAGPYQSRPAGMEMLDCLSEVIDEKEREAIQKSDFIALTIDESTDRTIKHNLAMYVSYIDDNGNVLNRYRKLEEIKGSANAKALFDLVKKALEDDGIDMKKIVGFTSDGASVMVGEHKGVAALLKKECPGVLSLHCAAHKLALSCADLFKGDEELLLLDGMISKIYGYFKVSPLRREDLRSLQELLKAKEYKLLKPHAVRWLSRARCIRRLKELYPVLLEYFKQETGPNAEAIYSWLK